MKGFGLGVAAALLAGACNVVPTVGVTPRYGPLRVDGDVGIASGGAVTTSGTDALGVDEDKGVLAPRIDAAWLGFDAWASWYDARFAGSGRAEGQLDLGGVVIAADEPTDTEFDILMGTSGLTYDLIPGDLVDLGVGLGFGYVDFDAQITSQTTLQTVRSSETYGMPLLAARAAVEVGDLELSLVVAGMSLSIDGDRAAVLDADAALSWSFLHAGPAQGYLVLGYRMTRVRTEYHSGGSDVEADLALTGPYGGLTIQL